jgi:hypothetical protein
LRPWASDEVGMLEEKTQELMVNGTVNLASAD